MKLNLAALPKEEAWRIWSTAFQSGGYLRHIAPTLLESSEPGPWIVPIVEAGVDLSQTGDNRICRRAFEYWYEREVERERG